MEASLSVVSGGDVAGRLAEMGLEEEPLREVVSRCFHSFISCTQNHPPFVKGIWQWGEAVRFLREYTLPLGLRRSDEDNFSVVVDDERRFAIAVATGDEATGIAELLPTTRAQKGISTLLAVVENQAQLNLFTDAEAPVVPVDNRKKVVTWILLIHRAKDEVRCELSLPSSMGEDGRINAWHERIILAAVPVNGDQIEIDVPNVPEIVVEVNRKVS